MKKFDLKKAILENKATFHSSLSENESTYEGKKSKKYYEDAEADDAEHIKALEKDMKDDKKASKKLKENLNTPTSVPELIFQIQKKYPRMNWLESELPNNPTFQDIKGTLEDFGYGKVYDEFMGGDMDDIMTDLNETNTKMKKSDLKAKIKEMIVAEYEKDVDYTDETSGYDFLAELEGMLNEADETEKDTAEVDTTDVAVDDTETVTTSTEVEVDPNVKAVQDALTQAQVAAQKLGDKKLTDQIGNTITFFTREHVVEKPKTAVAEADEMEEGKKEDLNESMFPMLNKILK